MHNIQFRKERTTPITSSDYSDLIHLICQVNLLRDKEHMEVKRERD